MSITPLIYFGEVLLYKIYWGSRHGLAGFYYLVLVDDVTAWTPSYASYDDALHVCLAWISAMSITGILTTNPCELPFNIGKKDSFCKVYDLMNPFVLWLYILRLWHCWWRAAMLNFPWTCHYLNMVLFHLQYLLLCYKLCFSCIRKVVMFSWGKVTFAVSICQMGNTWIFKSK